MISWHGGDGGDRLGGVGEWSSAWERSSSEFAGPGSFSISSSDLVTDDGVPGAWGKTGPVFFKFNYEYINELIKK